MALRALGVTAGVLLSAVTGAHAASVSTSLNCLRADCSGSFAAFEADPGEANRLSISSGGGVAVFSEASVPIRAGRACVLRSTTMATCQGRPEIVALGDGDDQASSTAGGKLVGGPGNDRLEGGTSFDGGPGSDTLLGTSGPNAFIDGDAGERDTYNGGNGSDSVSYTGRSAAIRLTIGTGGTEDVLNSIESATGGAGDDTLTGDAGPNTLSGLAGRDTIVAGPGDDTLDGGSGRDTLDAGTGNDTLNLSKGARVECGPGKDTVSLPAFGFPPVPALTANVPTDCEAADFRSEFLLLAPPRRKGRGVHVRVRSNDATEGDSRLRLLVGRRVIGQTRTVRRSGTYRIKLGLRGRQLVRRGRGVTLQRRGVTKALRKDVPGDSLRYRLR